MTKEILNLLSSQEAINKFLTNIPVTSREIKPVDVIHSLGMVTATDVFAPEPAPVFTRSTMDGYAVCAGDTLGTSESQPVCLKLVGEIPVGRTPEISLSGKEAALIHTGGMLPEGADAVVMVENTQAVDSSHVDVFVPVEKGENVVMVGEDVAKNDVIVPAGRHIRSMEIGGMLSMGVLQVSVLSPLRVGILSSGDEVVPPNEIPRPGQVRDINSYSLGAVVQQHGGVARYYGIVPDRYELLRDGIKKALSECDIVVVTAGSSVSTRDMTAPVIQELGQPGVLVHGINIRPGKPTIFAVCDGKPVIGLPGNPVSALVIASLFMGTIMDHMLGVKSNPLHKVNARLKSNLSFVAGRENWIPVQVTQTENGLVAEPVFFKSSLIFSLVRANGLAYIPTEYVEINAGDDIQVLLL